MIPLRMIPLVLKQIVRRRTRSLLTILGVASAMFLFSSVEALQAGVREATGRTAQETTLVVYRQNRYCPFSSRLPQHYEQRIAGISGVVAVVPIQIVVSNCRTGLDVVTYRGVPADQFSGEYASGMTVTEGSITAWQAQTDGALVGDELAQRRRLRAGDRFEAAGVNVQVAGIVTSDRPQDRNVAYVHLSFLQQAAGARKLGTVTQFNVKVADPSLLQPVAAAIDAEFATDPDPTSTSGEQAFVARAAEDVVRIVAFTGYLATACLVAVLALVANAVVLSIQDRVKEHAVLQTLGFAPLLVGRLVVAEGMLLGLAGGIVGTLAANAVLHYGKFGLSSEGLTISMTTSLPQTLMALLISAILGVVASLVPAVQASRRQITNSLRAV